MENTKVLNELLDEEAIEFFNANRKEYGKQLDEFMKINKSVGIDLGSSNDFSVIGDRVIKNK